MSRPNIYAQHCEPDGSCGCCADLTEADSTESAFLMPENVTPEQRLLWGIFGKRPEESESEQ